jgi:hypothetical protein
MKVTTQRKVTFGILGLAAIAFVVDRCTSSSATPSSAHAMVATAKVPGRVAALPPGAAVVEFNPFNLETVSARLEKVAAEQGLDASHTRDAFVPSNLWKPSADAKAETGERLASAGRFRQQHKLLAVMFGRQGGMALLDGKPVRAGQIVDGFRLVEVHERDAVFEAGATRVQLTVVGPAQVPGSADNVEIRPSRAGQIW